MKPATRHHLPARSGVHRIKRAKASKQPESARPLAWIDELIASVPPEEWDNFPTDGSVNHDHYLYGAPKRKG